MSLDSRIHFTFSCAKSYCGHCAERSAEQYGETKVWKNTQDWTRTSVPSLFVCGADHAPDCAPERLREATAAGASEGRERAEMIRKKE